VLAALAIRGLRAISDYAEIGRRFAPIPTSPSWTHSTRLRLAQGRLWGTPVVSFQLLAIRS